MSDRRTPVPTARTLTANGLGDLAERGVPLTPSIHLSATSLRDADNSYGSAHMYGRSESAGVQGVERLLARLDRAEAAMLFGSGTAAASAVIEALEPRRIVAPRLMYYALRADLSELAARGTDVAFVDMADLGAVDAALAAAPTDLVWIETPSNPLWTLTDIAAVAALAHRAGARLVADATAATPILTRPLALGADLVVHSATKYLNGHSDLVAGVAATRDAASPLWARMKTLRERHGGALGAFDVWLLARGLRTLDLRVRAQSRSALYLAERLAEHPGVRAVLYPGLPDHPGHAVAARQMSGGFGGMLSIRLAGGVTAALAAIGRVRLWRRATSFGGVESLVEHRASVEPAGDGCPADLLRLSVGLEDPDELLLDLHDALL